MKVDRASVNLTTLQARSAERGRKRTRFQDETLRVVSDVSATSAEIKVLVDQVRDAQRFAREAQGLTGESMSVFTVHILSDLGFALMSRSPFGTVAAVATDSTTLGVPCSKLAANPRGYRGYLAHEFVHLQDGQIAGTRLELIPMYLQEGKASVIGDRYRFLAGSSGAEHLAIRNLLMKLHPDEAQGFLQSFRSATSSVPSADVLAREYTGALYVEWLRTRAKGSGFPNALDRIALVIKDVAGGDSYENAFNRRFGISVARSEQDFVRFLRETESAPIDRLHGTVYEAIPVVSSPRKDEFLG